MLCVQWMGSLLLRIVGKKEFPCLRLIINNGLVKDRCEWLIHLKYVIRLYYMWVRCCCVLYNVYVILSK
jgi:hypothetical protein